MKNDKRTFLLFFLILALIYALVFFRLEANIVLLSATLIFSRFIYLKLNKRFNFPKISLNDKNLSKNIYEFLLWTGKNLIAPLAISWFSTFIYGYVFPSTDSTLIEGQTNIKSSQIEINTKLDKIYSLIDSNDQAYISEMLAILFGDNYRLVLENDETYYNFKKRLEKRTLSEILNENAKLVKQINKLLAENIPDFITEKINILFREYKYSEIPTVIDEYILEQIYIPNKVLAKLYSIKAESFEFQSFYPEALRESEKALVLDNNNRDFLIQKAKLLKLSGKLDEALVMFMDLLLGEQKIITDGEEEVFSIMDEIIGIRIEKKQYGMARDLIFPILKKRNEDIEKEDSLEKTLDLLFTYEQLINILTGLRKFEEIDIVQEKAMYIRTSLSTNNKSFMAKAYNQKGVIYEEQGKYEKALEQFLLAKEAELTRRDSLDPELVYVYNNLGKTYQKLGNFKNAYKNLISALMLTSYGQGSDSPQFGYTLVNIANLFHDYQYYDECLDFIKESEENLIKNFGMKDGHLVNVYNLEGACYIGKGDFENGIFYLKKCIELSNELVGQETVESGMAYGNLGVAYSKIKESNKAIKHYKKSLEILFGFFPDGHPYIDKIKQNLDNALRNPDTN